MNKKLLLLLPITILSLSSCKTSKSYAKLRPSNLVEGIEINSTHAYIIKKNTDYNAKELNEGQTYLEKVKTEHSFDITFTNTYTGIVKKTAFNNTIEFDSLLESYELKTPGSNYIFRPKDTDCKLVTLTPLVSKECTVSFSSITFKIKCDYKTPLYISSPHLNSESKEYNKEYQEFDYTDYQKDTEEYITITLDLPFEANSSQEDQLDTISIYNNNIDSIKDFSIDCKAIDKAKYTKTKYYTNLSYVYD